MEISQSARARLDAMLEEFKTYARSQIGYPCNQSFDYSELYAFMRYSLNNVGDPFHKSNFRSNTHQIEREVIAQFADLMHLPKEQAWGYVSSGGTEGNMYGLYLARELLPNGVVYFSQDTHYSILKILRVLNIRNIMIKSQENGEIDYDDLYETIRIHRDVPVIFMANIGTTMKGAIDNLTTVHKIFNDLALSHFYIHADAALSGMILAFVEHPQPYGFDAGISSIAISGHKLIGAPLPCGVVLSRRDYVSRIARAIEYVGVLDTTLPGSRSALTPLMLWYAFEKYGRSGFKSIVANMLEVAEYAVMRFNALGVKAWRNEHSVTIVIPKPSQHFIRKWQIASQRDIAHIITMPHVDRQLIDLLIAEYIEDRRKQTN